MTERKRKRVPTKQRPESRKYLFLVGVLSLLGLSVAAGYLINRTSDQEMVGMEAPAVTVGAGLIAFQTHCAECHGKNAAGTDKGPPLVHPYYKPSHHADFAFVRAARLGVRQHHWRFGNMPAQPDVANEELDAIIGYVRQLQRDNGIF